MLETVILGQSVQPRGVKYAFRSRFRNSSPEGRKCCFSGLATANREPVGEYDSIHRAGAGGADAIDLDARVLEQPIQHAPSEGPMGTSALEREIDVLCRQW